MTEYGLVIINAEINKQEAMLGRPLTTAEIRYLYLTYVEFICEEKEMAC